MKKNSLNTQCNYIYCDKNKCTPLGLQGPMCVCVRVCVDGN